MGYEDAVALFLGLRHSANGAACAHGRPTVGAWRILVAPDLR